ncbi:MAG: NUDIX domain-containing protein [Clostridia bacterium]|nr:NUDIX domain-containing protein [Clostridia bacterium]
MAETNTNWSQSVTGIVIRDGCVLLARHTYGGGRGLFIVPGGYVQMGESPVDAVKREIMEETGVLVEPGRVIAVRTNAKDWYMAFEAAYLSGEARSDGDENDLVVWMPVGEALERQDVPELTKSLIRAAQKPGGLVPLPYQGNPKNGTGYLFGIE